MRCDIKEERLRVTYSIASTDTLATCRTELR